MTLRAVLAANLAVSAAISAVLAAVLVTGCAVSSPPTAPAPSAKARGVAARPLTPASPWIQAPIESGFVILPAGLTPCDAELWDAAEAHTRVIITSCNGVVQYVDQAAGAPDDVLGVCDLTPMLAKFDANPCPWQGEGVWRSHGGGVTRTWPLRYRVGADCFSMHYPKFYGCIPVPWSNDPWNKDKIVAVTPREGLTAPKIHGIRNLATSGHELVLLDADPTLALNQVRIIRSDAHFQYAHASIHVLEEGPTSANDVPHGVCGRGDGMLAVAGPTGVWFGAGASTALKRVYVPPAEGPPSAAAAPGCCDIAWQANLVGPGTFVLAPRQRPELVLLDDATGAVLATWSPPASSAAYAPVAVRALSVNVADATVVFTVEEQSQAEPTRHVVRWVGWPLLGTRRGAAVPLTKPGLASPVSTP